MTDADDRAKDAAAAEAAGLVENGMRLGLGTGSTAAFLIRRLGLLVRDGLRIRCAATSEATARLTRDEGIAVEDLDALGWLDLTIDGADEIDPGLTLIKGGGGALLREKIVAAASDRMVAIAENRKAVAALGAFPLPVEIVPFAAAVTRAMVEAALDLADVERRGVRLRMRDGAPARTDNGNLMLDLDLARIGDAAALSTRLLRVPGVVETGLFVGLCDLAILGHADGSTRRLGDLVERRNVFRAAEEA